MKRPRIMVVGSTNTDLVVPVPKLPAPGETVLGSGALVVTPGGKGANQAVAAARLGADVVFLTRVGEDDYGTQARARFQAEGIDTAHVLVTPGSASGVALIAVAVVGGENSIVVAPGANAALSPEDVDLAETALARAQAVVLSLEVPLPTVLRAAELAAHHGVPVILNPAPAATLPRALLEKVTYLTPNESEAQLLGGDSAALLACGVGAVITTLGASGAHVVAAGYEERLPAYPVTAVDTVAAGDCFTAALAVALAEGHSLRQAVLFASAAAALKVTRKGAQAGLPSREEVEQLTRSAR